MDMSERMLSYCPGQELFITIFCLEENQLPWNGPEHLEDTIPLALKRAWNVLISKFAQQQGPKY